MTITANAGPYVAFGQVAGTSESNPDRAPSIFDMGAIYPDPRAPFCYKPGGTGPTYGWYGLTYISALSIAPSTLSATAVAAANTVTTGVPMTLASSTANGVTVGQSVVNASTGVLVTGLLAIGTAGQQTTSTSFGTSGAVRIWSPGGMIARALSITAASTAVGGAFIIKGFDVYGYPMSEQITAVANTAVNGKKAWKYIQSVTPQFTDTTAGHTYSVGTTDIFGFPVLASSFANLHVNFGSQAAAANNVVTAATGFVAGAPATATLTTGDVRGTYALQTPSDGTATLTIFITPSPASVQSGAFPAGVAQF